MSRVFDYLSRKHPLPQFDTHVLFYDYVVIDKFSQRVVAGMPIDHSTGALDLETFPEFKLPWWAVIANHRYFVDGIAIHGSVTAMEYFPKFDAEAQSRRIACEDGIFGGHRDGTKYKYFHFGKDALKAAWQALREASEQKFLLYEDVEKHYDEADGYFGITTGDDEHDKRLGAFRAIHDDFVRKAMVKSWEDNRDEAGRRGTMMHNTNQYYYETPGCSLDNSRFDTPEFKQFRRFNDEWVLKRGLAPYRTELSMCDRNPKGRAPTYICGTIDIIWYYVKDDPKRRPKRLVAGDWKRTVDTATKSFSGKEFGYPPFQDWQACKTSERWLQLGTYTKIAEDNSHGDIFFESAYIVAFHEMNDDYITQPVPLHDEKVTARFAERMTVVFNEQRRLRCDTLHAERLSIIDELETVQNGGVSSLETTQRTCISKMLRLIDIRKLLIALQDWRIAAKPGGVKQERTIDDDLRSESDEILLDMEKKLTVSQGRVAEAYDCAGKLLRRECMSNAFRLVAINKMLSIATTREGGQEKKRKT
jgi:hypothetical protein